MMCGKCSKVGGWLMLIVGILFLLQNFGVWDFWGIQWYSAVLILFGLGAICSGGCPECQMMMKKR